MMVPTEPFKVTQGHRVWYMYRSKARIRDFLLVNNTTVYDVSYLSPFLSYRGVLVRLSLLTRVGSIQPCRAVHNVFRYIGRLCFSDKNYFLDESDYLNDKLPCAN